MRITPLDIRKQEFRKAMRGLDAEEVYAFLSTVGDEYEAVLNDNKALRERLLELDDKVQEYRTMEKTLRDTLLTAERVTVEAKDNARREANLIIKEAQIEADKSLRDIKTEARKLHQDVSQLRSQRESYLGRMKVIAESLLNFIGSVEDDFHEEDNAYSEQLPAEKELKPLEASIEPQRPLSNKDLFERRGSDEERGDDGENKPGGPSSVSVGSGRSGSPEERRRHSPGIPSDLRTGDSARKRESQPLPRPAVEEPPSPSTDEARAQADGDSTLDDIGSIIERMADGQKEILGQSGRSEAIPEARPAPRRREFDPVSATPSGPIATGDIADEPPKTLEATTDPPTPAGSVVDNRGADIQPGSGWEQTAAPETATAVETIERRTDSVPKGEADTKSTREMSLEQIRRDLERRMNEEKNKT
ncbi:MAG: DivIVA domain-containing protein [Candidatus Latescibacterota bacterium]|jgi:cell division initiation protein